MGGKSRNTSAMQAWLVPTNSCQPGGAARVGRGGLPGWAVRAWRSCQVMGPSLGLGRGPSGHRLPQRAWKEPK